MEYLSELVSFLVGLVGGSLLTLTFTKKQVRDGSSLVDQQSAKAGGDIIGRDKAVGKETNSE